MFFFLGLVFLASPSLYALSALQISSCADDLKGASASPLVTQMLQARAMDLTDDASAASAADFLTEEGEEAAANWIRSELVDSWDLVRSRYYDTELVKGRWRAQAIGYRALLRGYENTYGEIYSTAGLPLLRASTESLLSFFRTRSPEERAALHPLRLLLFAAGQREDVQALLPYLQDLRYWDLGHASGGGELLAHSLFPRGLQGLSVAGRNGGRYGTGWVDAEQILAAHTKLTQLRYLDVSWTGVSGWMFRDPRFPEQLTGLRIAGLRDQGPGRVTTEDLRLALAKFRKLQFIDISDSSIDPDFLNRSNFPALIYKRLNTNLGVTLSQE